MNAIYDLVVVGGGINGVGVAQASAAAGYKTILLEKKALAAGTSSRSSKLIHGGLRYLEQGQLGLVRESLRERALLLRNGPELVHLERFYLPLYRWTRRRTWQVRSGLALYALLGGGGFRTVPRREWQELDGLRLDGLQTVFQYWDAQTDDAGLTRAVMASAVSLGAELFCPAELRRATVDQDRLLLEVEQQGRRLNLEARALVNAAGPWANRLLSRLSPPVQPLAMELVQGAHIVVAAEPPGGIFYLEAMQDGRAVFVMPWQGMILVGSTESRFAGELDEVRPYPAEIDYLKRVLDDYFPGLSGAVIEQFAGLRVLPAGSGSFFTRSREVVLHGATAVPPVLTIYGGKLTTYRATAEKVLRRLQPLLPDRRRIAYTADLFLSPEDGG